jgi:hypothetical protein
MGWMEDLRNEAPTHVLTVVDHEPLFTHSAGLVAVHPTAALADEVGYFAWLLRREAYDRFQFDPDQVFGSSPSLTWGLISEGDCFLRGVRSKSESKLTRIRPNLSALAYW